jgi:hypothetical protein
MGREITYPAGDITKALRRLAANAGDITATSDELIDDRFKVPEDTLRTWMLDTHAEQYRRLERDQANATERRLTADLRKSLGEMERLKRELLGRMEDVKDGVSWQLLPSFVKTVADAQSKATVQLLQLEGRPTNPSGGDGDLLKLVTGLVAAGVMRPAPGVTLEPRAVPSDAVEIPDQPAGGQGQD